MYHPSYLKNETRALDPDLSAPAASTAWVAEQTARALAQIREWHEAQDVELPVDAVVDALREVANMTAEEEAEWNRKIEAGEV